MNILKLVKSLIPNFLKQKIRVGIIRRRFPGSIIYDGAEVGSDCEINRGVVIFKGVQLALGTLVGRYSYVQSGSVLWNAEVGPFCSIARNVTIGLAAHPISMVSTSPVFYDSQVPLPHIFVKGTYFKESLPRTYIGADVWIGEGVKIRAGVTVGDGAIIGAGSVVTKDIPPYAVCAGVPCKEIRKRFPIEDESAISSSFWWKWDESRLIANAKSFHDVKEFKELIKQSKL